MCLRIFSAQLDLNSNEKKEKNINLFSISGSNKSKCYNRKSVLITHFSLPVDFFTSSQVLHKCCPLQEGSQSCFRLTEHYI